MKQRPLTSRREFIPIASKEVTKKEKDKLTIKFDKTALKEEKKGANSSRPAAPLKIPLTDFSKFSFEVR